MMETSQLLLDLQAALANDNDFVTWCQTSLGAKPTIQIELFNIEELKEAACPFIGFFEIFQEEGLINPRLTWDIKMIVGVHDVKMNKSELNGCVLNSYRGRLRAEDLRERVVDALYNAGIGCNIKIVSSPVTHQYHPRFYSGVQLTITKQK